ncbi:MAG: hypothetical protein JNL63_11065 [Bacteroidia bacterium]|nr:hypothetical protein [Bacteroidia bacterium]
MDESEQEINKFLLEVKLFENAQPYDDQKLQRVYVNMVRSLIGKAVSVMPVYITVNASIRPLEPELVQGYFIEPYAVAYKLSKESKITAIDYSQFDFPNPADNKYPRDYMASMICDYYSTLFLNRADLFEAANRSEAIWLRQMALELADSKEMKRKIEDRMDKMSTP